MRLRAVVPTVALLLAAPAGAAAQQAPIRGFPADALAAQARREEAARAVPSADSLDARVRLLSEHPHEAGTDRSRRVAEAILQRFRSFGLDAEIEVFESLMPRPVTRTVELLEPERVTLALREQVIEQDKDARDADQLPTYNAFSPDGDVTGELVYVNYGVPDDYRVLDSLGISVKGKIVIARYGRSWRGIKPKVAAERGALATIIYSDPKDDGFYIDDVYPKGPMRPDHGVQRGSVMDMPTHPGDPLSPGWASEPGSRRLTIAEAKTIEPIPVLPISYGDALPLLRNLGGPVAPESWRGALPITYHIGGGPARVRVALKFDWQTRPLYNPVARIRGSVWPDQWVVYGNHHDAWVNGAQDPISGMAALEETARSLGRLLKTGWRPARTIILMGWDGEEWGLLGSTEWAEKWQKELKANAVAYINSDTNDKGWLGVGGSHSLQTFVYQVARDIKDPKRGMSVLDAALKRRRELRPSAVDRPAPPQPAAVEDTTNLKAADLEKLRADSLARAQEALRPGPDTAFSIFALGSGSDYTAFLDFLGLPTLNVSYGGDSRAGIYHSVYDTYDFYKRFLDPDFAFGVAEAQTTTTTLLRLADAPILPFEFGNAARTYRGYVDEIEKEAKKKEATKALDLSGVRAALGRLEQAAARYERAIGRLDGASSRSLRSRRRELAAVNQLLYQSEQQLTEEAGLPERPWFKHLIYAPGFYTGYGVKTMPGIREAVEDKPDLAVATREAARVVSALDRYAAQVTRAAEGVENILK